MLFAWTHNIIELAYKQFANGSTLIKRTSISSVRFPRYEVTGEKVRIGPINEVPPAGVYSR